MAEEARKARVTRTNKMSAFTRKRNHLQQLLDGAAPGTKLTEVYTELSDAYLALERAHEDYMLVIDEAGLDAETTYLDSPSTILGEMDLKVSKAADTQNQLKRDLEKREKESEEEAAKKRKYSVALATFKANIMGFGKPSGQLSTLSNEKRISIADMRLEVKKIEYAKLAQQKLELLNLDPEVIFLQNATSSMHWL